MVEKPQKQDGAITRMKMVFLASSLWFLLCGAGVADAQTPQNATTSAPQSQDANLSELDQTIARANQGDAQAQYNLCGRYIGGFGIERDLTKAMQWCQRSADQGNGQAQLDLGLRYMNGSGLPQDNVQAHLWLDLAKDNFPALKANIVATVAVVEAKMTKEQIAQAIQLKDEWKTWPAK